MPKIRGIKPEFWTDDAVVDLSIPARLLFIGLWNYACDNGHLQDKPKQIKMRLLPGDDVNCAELLRELEASGRISRGDGWITVHNLTEHQKVDVRYFTTCDKTGCDDPPEKVSQREARRAPAVHTSGTQRAHVGALGDGDGEVMVNDGDGEGTRARKRAAALPDDFRPSEAHQSLAAELGVNLRAEWPQFVDHHRSKGSTMKDWDAALRTWIRNAKKFSGLRGVPASVTPIRDSDGHPILPPPQTKDYLR